MKPPEPMVVFDGPFIGTAYARDGNVTVDGYICTPEAMRQITQHLNFLADAAEKQREYEHEQAQSKSLEK